MASSPYIPAFRAISLVSQQDSTNFSYFIVMDVDPSDAGNLMNQAYNSTVFNLLGWFQNPDKSWYISITVSYNFTTPTNGTQSVLLPVIPTNGPQATNLLMDFLTQGTKAPQAPIVNPNGGTINAPKPTTQSEPPTDAELLGPLTPFIIQSTTDGSQSLGLAIYWPADTALIPLTNPNCYPNQWLSNVLFSNPGGVASVQVNLGLCSTNNVTLGVGSYQPPLGPVTIPTGTITFPDGTSSTFKPGTPKTWVTYKV